MITFKAKTHQYFDGDRELISVTKALQDAGLVNTDYFLPKHAQRGRAVHKACVMEAQKILDPTSLDPQIVGYVQAWRKFLRDLNATPIALEYIVADRDLGYAGRVDCLLSAPSLPRHFIVDIKSGSPASWHATQLGAYLRCDPGWGC